MVTATLLPVVRLSKRASQSFTLRRAKGRYTFAAPGLVQQLSRYS